jgi:hypothetical protein
MKCDAKLHHRLDNALKAFEKARDPAFKRYWKKVFDSLSSAAA